MNTPNQSPEKGQSASLALAVGSTLVERLREGAIQTPRRWSGDCGEMSTVDEIATDELMVKAADEIEQLEAKYYDLIYAVSQKWPNETRHETAFRYIRQAETITNEPAQSNDRDVGRDEIAASKPSTE